VLPPGNLLASVDPIEQEIPKYHKYECIFHPIRFLEMLPLSHVFGQFMGMFIPPLIGGAVFFQESFKPSDVIVTIKRERISVLVAVPRVVESLKNRMESEHGQEIRRHWVAAENEKILNRFWRFRKIHRVLGWKFWAIISGGAALDQNTEEFWRRLGFVVIQGYGLTETSSLISLNHPFKVSRRSIGKVLPGREMKLDPSTGEILVRGANVARQYWQGKEMKPVAGEEGWFRTGDLGEVDAEGNLYFKGRSKNVIVTPAGLKIFPEDLEQALRRQPEVRDCVVFGTARGGNAEPCAALLLRNGGSGSEVVARANQSLADFQKIRCWLVWPDEDFPRTSTQKPKMDVSPTQRRPCRRSIPRCRGIVGDNRRTNSEYCRCRPGRGLVRNKTGRHAAGRRPQPEFAGPRRTDGRYREPLSDRAKRQRLLAGDNRRRSGKAGQKERREIPAA
jgi:long-chain acyl-CoA synthetase